MPPPDLPVELWLEILSYLPRTALHKMIGVNRILFELALNDLYEEVRFISDDRDTLKTFEQLKHLGIANRVRHLFIRPAFLPGTDEETESTFKQKLASGAAYLRNFTKNPSSITFNDSFNDPSYEILETAKIAVKACPNLHEITIVLHDLALTPLFMLFLDSLWASDSIGPNLRKLSIDTTVIKLPLLLNPLTKRSKLLTNLEEFDINISVTRLNQTPTDWHFASGALVAFLAAFKATLTSLTFSSLINRDLGTLFESFPRLRKLKKFEFLSVFNATSVPQTEDFTKFISRHAPTLETLVVKPHARHITVNTSDDTYSIWLNHNDALESERLYSFAQLVLPKLRTLDIGLRDMHGDMEGTERALMPDLSRVTPNLTSLIITDVRLSSRRVFSLLNTLGQREGGSLLERLSFTCVYISPPLFDLLAKNLPRLKSLTIEYASFSPKPEHQPFVNDEFYTDFYKVMQARSYPRWGLEYLRLVTPYHCGGAHPIVSVMESVAESLPKSVVLDTELTCQCKPGIYFNF
ncbi:hypothetical protein BDZ97DRAFT_1806324 [Flammula alnicola]|nr:hypothetical protein BDZ97DRAFT_1806324 [Flammula alnicola]